MGLGDLDGRELRYRNKFLLINIDKYIAQKTL